MQTFPLDADIEDRVVLKGAAGWAGWAVSDDDGGRLGMGGNWWMSGPKLEEKIGEGWSENEVRDRVEVWFEGVDV